MQHEQIDLFFAKTVAPEAPDSVTQFLANLVKGAREGHLCLPLDPGLELPPHLFDTFLVEKEGRIYLRRNWECEDRFLEHASRLKRTLPAITLPELSLPVLEPEQKRGILQAASRSLSLICGGPGTGKTYTAVTLIQSVLPYLKPVVAAPTGKATANLRKALKGICPIETLHSLLKKSFLTADLVLVDEASMIDAELMAKLFSAIKEGGRLVLIGDRDQLPPVETGHFFADLAQDEELVTSLGKSLRAELKEIVEWAGAVKEGKEIPFAPMPDFEELCRAVFEEKAVVLTPLRHGPFGVNRLNQKLHMEHLKRGGKEIPIMITVNENALELFNGDVGILDCEKECAYFGERQFPAYLLPPYEYAYVLSVHKSQGSEYDRIIVLLPEGSEVFGREMLYTAITRAKKQVTLFAAPGILTQIVAKSVTRYSGLSCKAPSL